MYGDGHFIIIFIIVQFELGPVRIKSRIAVAFTDGIIRKTSLLAGRYIIPVLGLGDPGHIHGKLCIRADKDLPALRRGLIDQIGQRGIFPSVRRAGETSGWR